MGAEIGETAADFKRPGSLRRCGNYLGKPGHCCGDKERCQRQSCKLPEKHALSPFEVAELCAVLNYM